MRRLFALVAVLTALTSLAAGGLSGCGGGAGGQICDDGREALTGQYPDLGQYVDPLIGTRGAGNVVPGAAVPHGMVKLSPDTNAGAGSIDAYDYDNDRIEGFSHTHLEGPGGSSSGYSQILITAMTGVAGIVEERYSSAFAHDTEVAAPGYYAVTLADYGVRAELTATRRCGLHRYTFDAAADAHVIVDVGHARGDPVDGHIEVVGTDTVQGYGVYQVYPAVALGVGASAPGTTGVSTVYFVARSSRPFGGFGTWQGESLSAGTSIAAGKRIGAVLDYAAAAGDTVEVRVGLSFISVDQARAALDCEVGSRTFEEIRAEAASRWDRLLSRVEVEGGTDDQRRALYTALYHSLLQPADYTEDGQFWSGADGTGAVFKARDWRFYTDDWCIWDTFRTTHPLLTLVEPEVPADMVRSLVHLYQQGGWMPKCPWNATGDSRDMTSNPQFCVVADAWAKGYRDFDTDAAWAALRKGSLEDSHNPFESTLCGYFNQGTPPDYVSLGWVPHECDGTQSASMTLEYAYDDWCVATFAAALGHGDDEALFRTRAQSYRNVFNPTYGFMQPRRRDGTWVEPFDPTGSTGFTEANSWQYTWSVQHDVCGLVELMGGADAFTARLDEFFAGAHFAADNEPDFHTPFLYNYVGAPAKTQELVRALLDAAYSSRPDGLPGNDDAGATSSWYVFAALGLYPVTPGEPVYALASPIFTRATLHVDPDRHPGVDFVIEAPAASPENLYVQAATLNGVPLDEPRLDHDAIMAGGTLLLEMGPAPSSWGSTPRCP
jgi:predicted alpha-1,2-mannosidase